MATRDAHASIRGYIFQFNTAIREILESPNDAEITIEGIEDYDIQTEDGLTAVQCKYYEGTEYNHSEISEAISYMLRDYHKRIVNESPLINYRLYGYYQSGYHKLEKPISIEFLKSKFLTYTRKGVKNIVHEDLNISDDQLADFISRLDINNHAESFEDLFRAVLSLIKEIKRCSDFESEHYYYNNALSLIERLAIKQTILERTVKRQVFLEGIDKKEILFNQWLLQLKGERAFISSLKRQFFNQLNLPRKDRFFIIDIPHDSHPHEIIDLIVLISKKYSKLSKRDALPFCPYVFLNMDYNSLCEIRHKLYDIGVLFFDGYPYHDSRFQSKAIHTEANASNGIQIRIIENSAFLEETIATSPNLKEVYQFYGDSLIFNFDNPYIKHVKIQTNKINRIMRII